MNTSPQRELKHLEEAVQSSPSPQRRSWIVMAAGSVAVVGLAFLAMMYVGWSAGLADTSSPLVDASVARQEDAPAPTVAASEMAAKSVEQPKVAENTGDTPEMAANGFPVLSETNVSDYSLDLLRRSTDKNVTVPGDIQSCISALDSAEPIRQVQQVQWQEKSTDVAADSWLIVTSETGLRELQVKGGVISVVVMPLSCAQSGSSSEASTALVAEPMSYILQKISVPSGLLTRTGSSSSSVTSSP